MIPSTTDRNYVSSSLPTSVQNEQAPNKVAIAAQKSFEQYRKEQEANGEPVALLFGRGTKANSDYPKLNETFSILSPDFERIKKPYKPFTVDRNPLVNPHLTASIMNLEEMNCFPNESVDDIYLERIFPTCIQTSFEVLFTAARILKLDGKLFAEFNHGKYPDKEQKIVQLMQDICEEYSIPLFIHIPAIRAWQDRSDWYSTGFECIKREEFNSEKFDRILFLKARGNYTRKLNEIIGRGPESYW